MVVLRRSSPLASSVKTSDRYTRTIVLTKRNGVFGQERIARHRGANPRRDHGDHRRAGARGGDASLRRSEGGRLARGDLTPLPDARRPAPQLAAAGGGGRGGALG